MFMMFKGISLLEYNLSFPESNFSGSLSVWIVLGSLKLIIYVFLNPYKNHIKNIYFNT